MTREILDQWGGVVTTIQEDPNDETAVLIGTHQDAAPILENNQRLATMNDGYSASRELKRVASIPLSLAEQWVREAGLSPAAFWRWPAADRNEFFRRKYRSSEFRKLLTAPSNTESRMFTG